MSGMTFLLYVQGQTSPRKWVTYHGPEALGQLEALAKQRSLLVQGAGGRVQGIRKLGRALVQRVWEVIHLLVDKVKDAGGLYGGRVRQRGQERIPKDRHYIVVQDPATACGTASNTAYIF